MLNIHQPYIKKEKVKCLFALASIGVLLLGSLVGINNFSTSISVYAAGDSRTIHDIENMQDMTQQICSNTDIGDTETLIDKRGTNISYKVIKMGDGTCWMTENLRLINITIDSTDSDMESGSFTIPASNVSGFNPSNQYQPKAYYNSDTVYGAYYNWYTATAGFGTNSIISAIDTDKSICPKNWKLPAYDGAGSFLSLNDVYSGPWTSANGKNGRYIGDSSTFWPAAGYTSYDSLTNADSSGIYWSRKADSSGYANNLTFYSSYTVPQASGNRFTGNSIRCVALGGLPKIEAPIWEESAEGNVNVNVPSILTIDATSGMEEIADASKIIEGTATATISSNTTYSVTLHSTQPALKDIENSSSTAEISPVSKSNPVQPGNNSWGILQDPSTTGNVISYSPITTSPQEFYNTTSSSITDRGPTTIHTYSVGISISPALPSGTYATNITITAAVK